MISGRIGGRIGPIGPVGPEGPIGQLLTGAGSPQGVVTATVATLYLDTAATNGALVWVKASGSGNTGWRVLHGDTGWRDLTELLVNGWTMATPGYTAIRRIGSVVHVRTRGLTGSGSSSGTVATLPQGFLPTMQTGGVIGATTAGVVHPAMVSTTGALTIGTGTGGAALSAFVGATQQFSFPVTDSNAQAWPASLPAAA